MCPKPIRRRLPKHRKQVREKLFSFSTTALERLVAEDKDYYVRDSKTPGLNLKVTPAGKKVFLLRYNVPGRRGRKLTLGVLPRISVPQARKLTMEAWAEIGNGHDPAQKRSDLANAVTVKEFAQKYLEDQVKIRTSPRTASDYKSMLNNHVLPLVGHMRLEDVTRADVEKLHHSMNATPARANRTIAVVKAMFNKAGDWGIIPYSNNPAIRLKLYKENPRVRQFQAKEQEKIGSANQVLRERYPMNQPAFDAIIFLFRTGCRTSEALNLRWDDIDFEGRTAFLRTSKTGQGSLYLGQAAIELLQSIAASTRSDWVFPGRTKNKPLEGLKRPWDKVCTLAELENARLHDIRHTMASQLAASGQVSSATAVLRHTNSGTTDNYIHANDEVIRRDLDYAVGEMQKRGL